MIKQKISAWGKSYFQNFREHPGKATVALVLQILFAVGWVGFFYMVFKDFANTVIPGTTDPKSNIYAECVDIVAYTIVYTYIFYRLLPLMFANDKMLRHRVYAFLISAAAAFFLPDLSLAPFLPDSWQEPVFTAFWAD